ncbi:hypothetical protein ACFVFI_08200 [Streptomyces sp. NPDC057705]
MAGAGARPLTREQQRRNRELLLRDLRTDHTHTHTHHRLAEAS